MERNRLAVVAAVLATIGALSAFDLFLARTQNRETSAEARQDYEAGTRLLAENRPGDAIDLLRKAHALDRSDLRYSLELASALSADGRPEEAQAMLGDVLETSPNNGEANLLEARLMVRQDRISDATSYYHRAIFGSWNAAPGRGVQVRLELARLLASRGQSRELLAELLPIETEARDLPTRKQVAHLFLVAGAPARAAAAYRALMRDDPRDRSDYNGLGDAELASGNFRSAASAFQSGGAGDRARLAEDLAALDPTPRRLSAGEKLARATRVLEVARKAACPPASDDSLEKAADELLAKKIRTATNELAEARLTLAEQIWDQRAANCAAPADARLKLIMSKLEGPPSGSPATPY